MKKRYKLKTNENTNEKIDEALDLINTEYNSFFDNFKEIHNKSSTLIAFHGAIIIFFNDSSLYKITELSNYSGSILCLSIIKYILLAIILGLALASIILLLSVINSGTIQRLNLESINENFYNFSLEEIKKNIIEIYKENLKKNSKVLLNKHKKFTASLILTIIEMCFIIVYMIFKII